VGNKIGFTHALWTGFQLMDLKEEHDYNVATVKLLNNHSPNDLLTVLLPHVSILSFHEIIPSMNDVFIQTVNRSHAESNS
jgi:ABC-2 type transport system ATP-binding protein